MDVPNHGHRNHGRDDGRQGHEHGHRHPHVENQVLGGRAGRFNGFRSEQLFFQYNLNTNVDPIDPTNVNAAAALDLGWTSDHAVTFDIAADCERLWLVVVRSRELQRNSVAPLNPVSRQTIESGPVPAGASACNNSVCKLLIGVRTTSGRSQFLIDCDHELEVWGSSLDIQVLVPGAALAPARAFKIGSTTPITGAAAPALTGLVVDSLLGCTVIPIEESKSQREAPLTQQLRVAANTAGVIEVPRAAVAVKIYQTTQGVASAQWIRFIGDPAVTASNQQTGTIAFTGRTSQDFDNQISNETHLQTDVDPANNRLYTVLWTIRP